MSNLFGDDFSSFTSSKDAEEIDFEFAASAFPDISLDGSSDVLTLPTAPSMAGSTSMSGFSFDDFDPVPNQPAGHAVKVTGNDEIEKFESEFPDIEVPAVSRFLLETI